MRTHYLRFAVTFVLIWLWSSRVSWAVTFDQAVRSMADELAIVLNDVGNDKVVPKYDGALAFPGGVSTAFAEAMKETLATKGIRIAARADLVFAAHLELTTDFAARLSGKLIDAQGKTIREIEGQSIEDGRDLAESMGVTTDFHLASTSNGRQQAFRQHLDNKTIYVNESHTILLGGEDSPFGVEVRVKDQPRRFNEDVEGLAYVDLHPGEEYEILLHNNSHYEVAVDLKIDGLNRFHFAERAYDHSDGQRRRNSKYYYLIIKPHATHVSSGWYKSDSRVSRYRITPIEDSAAATAGIPLTDVGMVSATFQASWKTGSPHPADEPAIRRIVTEVVKVTKFVPEQVVRSDGTVETFVKPVSETKTIDRWATGFGTELPRTTYGVQRTVGVPRATIVFRYGR